MEDGVNILNCGSDQYDLSRERSHGSSESETLDFSAADDVGAVHYSWIAHPGGPTPPQSPTLPTSPMKSSSSHKRSFSGGILGRLSFLRNNNDTERPTSPVRPRSRDKLEPTSAPKSRTSEDEHVPTSPTSPTSGKESAMAAALKQQKTRRRKGSLRKTALLGGRVGRERKGSLTHRSPSLKQQVVITSELEEPTIGPVIAPTPTSPTVTDAERIVKRQFSYDSSLGPDAPSSSSSIWSADHVATTTARLSLLTAVSTTPVDELESKHQLSSPLDMKSPASQTSATSYASTTDEEEGLIFERPATNSQHLLPTPPVAKPLSASATSYFPSTLPRKNSSTKRSPLSRSVPLTPSPYSPVPDPHDYTETSYWGWVILIITWITFTVGMGSCLEVWSWAWDVGETPYAPPELEDDATLPIVGYYPALIVLTGVVAWVWVTVAWVGMKYFRHAKIEV